MRKLFAALCLTGALSLASHAEAAIGTPANLLGNAALPNGFSAAGSASNTTTTTVDAPAGSLIIVVTGKAANATISDVKDSAGNCANAYTNTGSINLNTVRMAFAYCNGTGSDLPVGGTFTTDFSLTTGAMAQTAATLSGVATSSPIDSSAQTSTSNTGTSVSGISITPTHGTDANGEMLFACIYIKNAATGDNYAEDTGNGWTAWQGAPAGSTTNVLLHCAYQKVTTNSAVTWAPSWTNSRGWAATTTGFLSAGSAVKPQQLLLLGVGQ